MRPNCLGEYQDLLPHVHLHVYSCVLAIFTGNPRESARVYKPQEAVLDRMITVTIGQFAKDCLPPDA